ncbi:MAG: hypothetical protein ACTHL8_05240 [Burkholderiaceae bacterium]
MSPRWNRRLRLRVAPDRVSATLRSSGLRAAAPAHARRAVAPADGAAAADDLAAAVEAVIQDLASQAPLAGARLHVELSTALLHLDVAEGDFSDCPERELQGIAATCAQEMLGDDAADHDLRWALQRDERHLLIAAIPRARLALFESLARSADARLASVQPDFTLRWNEFGRVRTPGRSVFAVSSPADLSIAIVVDGAIACVSTGPGVDIATELEGDLPSAVADRVYASGAPALLVTTGDGNGRGAFSSTRPMPQVGADALDARVDRLLRACGDDPAAVSSFLLVAADARSVEASSRWTVAGLLGAMP